MTTFWVVATVLLVALLLAWYLTWTATRLDRLHARIEGARAALETQLMRRASVALELATSGQLDPASAILVAEAAHEARDAEGDDRELVHSDLTRALRATLDEPGTVEALRADPVGRDLLDQLDAACHRTQLSRRFHNDAVRSAVVVRRKRVVRALRLAGHAGPLVSFEMDDEPPAALVH